MYELIGFIIRLFLFTVISILFLKTITVIIVFILNQIQYIHNLEIED